MCSILWGAHAAACCIQGRPVCHVRLECFVDDDEVVATVIIIDESPPICAMCVFVIFMCHVRLECFPKRLSRLMASSQFHKLKTLIARMPSGFGLCRKADGDTAAGNMLKKHWPMHGTEADCRPNQT